MALEVISVSALARAIRAGDSRRFGLNLKRDRVTVLQEAVDEALNSPPVLSPFSTTKIRGRNCVSYQRYNDHLVLRSISRYLRRRLRIPSPDRRKLTAGIIQALTDGGTIYVLRRDIKDFYESIDSSALQTRLLVGHIVTPRVREYLRHFFQQHCPGGTTGVPRGAGISALLAELHMEEFDRRVRGLDGVFRYYRYADDIVVLATSPDVSEDLLSALPDGMSFNNEKTADFALDPAAPATQSFEYLGYRYDVEQGAGSKGGRKVSVSISAAKISRLKSRIIVSAKAFARHGDFALLCDRLRFLTSNYEVRRSGTSLAGGPTHVRSGIFYNYLHCGTYSPTKTGLISYSPWSATPLRALDGMMHSTLFGAGSTLSAAVKGRLSSGQRKQLSRLSFYHGYHHRFLVRMPPYRVSEVKSVWRNV